MTEFPLSEPEPLLDDVGQQILRALQENARISFAELGRKVGLSAPAITDRVRKMEEVGIIAGYHARVNSAKVGLPVTAYATLHVAREHFQGVIALAREIPEIRECHNVNPDGFLLKVIASSRERLEATLDSFRAFGDATALIVSSTPVQKYST